MGIRDEWQSAEFMEFSVMWACVWVCVCVCACARAGISMAHWGPVLEITEIPGLELCLAIGWWLEMEN